MGMAKFISLALGTVLILSGCMSSPNKAYTVSQPKAAPARNLTDMDLALDCLDRQLIQYRADPKGITSTGLPNRAGDKVSLNSGIDMLKTTVGQLRRSDVFHYIDFAALTTYFGANAGEIGVRPTDLNAIRNWSGFWQDVSKKPVPLPLPHYLITGSISQLDNNVTSDSIGAGLSVEDIGGVGVNWDQMVSVITVDMHVEDFRTLQLINGMTTRNSIEVVRTGLGANLNGRVKGAGAGYFTVSLDRSEGLHQAVRILIQLGTLELLGRLAHVPYEQCLAPAAAPPKSLEASEDGFDALSEPERVRFVQQRLATLPDPYSLERAFYYRGTATGVLDAPTRDAIARYQHQKGLLATGQIDLDLYRHLSSQPAMDGQVAAPALRFAAPNGAPLSYEFPVGTTLAFTVTANRDAHVQCFLRNQQRRVYRIFPTASQPNDFLTGGRPVVIPDPRAPKRILLNTPSFEEEEVGCLASAQPMRAGAALPLEELGVHALPVAGSLQDVLAQYQHAGEATPIGMEVFRFQTKAPAKEEKIGGR